MRRVRMNSGKPVSLFWHRDRSPYNSINIAGRFYHIRRKAKIFKKNQTYSPCQKKKLLSSKSSSCPHTYFLGPLKMSFSSFFVAMMVLLRSVTFIPRFVVCLQSCQPRRVPAIVREVACCSLCFDHELLIIAILNTTTVEAQ